MNIARSITSGVRWLFDHKIRLFLFCFLIVLLMLAAVAIGKIYQNWDDDPTRGAKPITDGAFGESYSTPIYLDQGWEPSESLWYYNTTQGSALVPYDFFLVLEQASNQELFRSDKNIDFYRYLPQKASFFNPDALPVGIVKDTYKGKDYVGYTCAACHTGQVNYRGKAVRIDGGPAMADMVGFLTGLQAAMEATLTDTNKRQRFIDKVIALDNDYNDGDEIIQSLEEWSKNIKLYNNINKSSVDYGYARLDAFGRIYNRVLQHSINKQQLATILGIASKPRDKKDNDAPPQRLLDSVEVEKVLDGVGENILVNQQLIQVLERLSSNEPGYPNLSEDDLLIIRDLIFNEANAPVSYPFLWDIVQSDYVQWNGLAGNAQIGPLGRNVGEVVGVFGKLDWAAEENQGFSVAAWLTDQSKKKKKITFESSIDVVNLKRLEFKIKDLQSPEWPIDELDLEKINTVQADRGQLIYAQYCQSCHEVIDRDNYDRIVIGKMSAVDFIGTDPAMAENGVNYQGKSGNFQFTTQSTDAGKVIIAEDAPVVQLLTTVTKGVVGTPDPDKFFMRRWLDRLYTLAMSFFNNNIPDTIKVGNYKPDTTANPYQSLLAYKARSLNGIWATAPYLHNGSVPTIYDLLLPIRKEGDPDEGEYRPNSFMVGSREFDPQKIGFRSEGYEGFNFQTIKVGDYNTGHEYGATKTPQLDGTILPPLTPRQRWDLVEYIKTL